MESVVADEVPLERGAGGDTPTHGDARSPDVRRGRSHRLDFEHEIKHGTERKAAHKPVQREPGRDRGTRELSDPVRRGERRPEPVR